MSDLALYRRLLRQAQPYALHLVALFCIGLLASPIALLNPVPLKIVVDSVLGAHPLPPVLRAILPEAIVGSRSALLAAAVGLLLAVAVLAQLQALANKFTQAYVGERLVLGFRTQLVQQAQRLSLSYHDSKGAADSLYRIQQDAAVIDKIMVEGIIPFITAAITLGTMIVVTARLTGSWRSWRWPCRHRCSACRACIAHVCGASNATSRSSRAPHSRSSRKRWAPSAS